MLKSKPKDFKKLKNPHPKNFHITFTMSKPGLEVFFKKEEPHNTENHPFYGEKEKGGRQEVGTCSNKWSPIWSKGFLFATCSNKWSPIWNKGFLFAVVEYRTAMHEGSSFTLAFSNGPASENKGSRMTGNCHVRFFEKEIEQKRPIFLTLG